MITGQCSNDALQFPQENLQDLDQSPFVDRDKELVLRSDGLWYKTSDGVPYEGIALTFHENGSKKTRAQYREGSPFGLIEEWDANGSVVGPRFKGEFNR